MLNFRSKFSWLVIIIFMKTTSPIVRLSNTALRILQTSNHLIEGVSVSQLLITMLDAALCSCLPPPPPIPPLAFEIERLWEWLCHLETREPIARWEEGTTRNVSKKAEERGCWKNPENKTKYQKRGFAVVCAEVCRGKRKRWSQRADTVFLTDFWQRQSKHCDSAEQMKGIRAKTEVDITSVVTHCHHRCYIWVVPCQNVGTGLGLVFSCVKTAKPVQSV